jgi:serine/threonine protein kinase
LRGRVVGETLPDEEVASDHPDLMPELAQELQALALIQQAEERASDTANRATGISADVTLPANSFPGYEIIGEIHRGGQGVVYEALQKSTQRKVAIKAMKEGPFGCLGDKTRFEREVQILGQLKHPHIVTIHDSGSVAGGLYFVMDYIAGNPLDEFMARKERTIPETLDLFACVCDAVNAAHLRGIIHRDLKPSNIRVDTEAEPHILDFGLAKVTTGEDERGGGLTGAGRRDTAEDRYAHRRLFAGHDPVSHADRSFSL